MKLFLAPLDGVTDFPVRVWFALLGGIDGAVTPFLRVTENYRAKNISPYLWPDAAYSYFAFPVIPQFMSSRAEYIAQVVAETPLRFVDLNCACPSRIVTRHGAGSALLRNPEIFAQFLSVWEKTKPYECLYSLKLRLGWSSDEEFLLLTEVLRNFSPAFITLHARTRLDGYKGLARWGWIDWATRKLNVPIYGSGDVVSLQCLKEKQLCAPNIAGVFIGRGALKNPWIFWKMRGENLCITKSLFLCVLQVLRILCHLYSVCPEKLLKFIETYPIQLLKDSEDAWHSFLETLWRFCCNQSVSFNFGENFALCRLKFFWKFMVSYQQTFCHDSCLVLTAPLQSQSCQEFLDAVANVIDDSFIAENFC